MGSGFWVVVVVVAAGLCLAVNDTHAASLPPTASPQPLSSLIQDALVRGLGYYPLEALIAQRILFSRLTSVARDLGYEVHDAMDSVKAVGYHMTTNSSLWVTLTPSLTTPPHDSEIQQSLKGVVRDYQNHRAWLSRSRTRRSPDQADESKTWYSSMVELVFGEKLPEALLPPPTHAVPRCFSFFSSPEVNTEGLEGLQDMVTDVTETLQEQNFISALADNLFLNSVFTSYSFVITEFLEDVGLGGVTSVGVLLSDIWLFHEIITDGWKWVEERCFLSTQWPFYYFYPEHCRLKYEQITQAAGVEDVADVAHAFAAHVTPDVASRSR